MGGRLQNLQAEGSRVRAGGWEGSEEEGGGPLVVGGERCIVARERWWQSWVARDWAVEVEDSYVEFETGVGEEEEKVVLRWE